MSIFLGLFLPFSTGLVSWTSFFTGKAILNFLAANSSRLTFQLMRSFGGFPLRANTAPFGPILLNNPSLSQTQPDTNNL
ncbi:hypothetical protein SRABI111_02776 [Pseudomonas carnis]|nr:hypothetical protein SRABI08_02290 [Pseudomonas carnis]CAH0235481.1 hypothetical protein SRABI111_02776 [Pseudomonas carnis]CAH0236768.1 hypothetical protein SRABI110_02876 [Pseudomonas carnis]CAH0263589.1 hypothetical protein SRABI64_03278 [Pseudomonas carnis]